MAAVLLRFLGGNFSIRIIFKFYSSSGRGNPVGKEYKIVQKLENDFPPRELKAFLVALYKMASTGLAKAVPKAQVFIFLGRTDLRKYRILL